jgi:hypothetical protein
VIAFDRSAVRSLILFIQENIMLTITTKEYELIKSASAVLWKRLETLSPDERESAEAFCRFSAKLDQRREQDKESQRERMKKFRTDPRSADRAREQTREASRRFRAKKKSEKEG